jgi:hypothetical protein
MTTPDAPQLRRRHCQSAAAELSIHLLATRVNFWRSAARERARAIS